LLETSAILPALATAAFLSIDFNFTYFWFFVWLLIKSDSLRMEKIWESILIEMRQSVDLQIETVIRLVCTSFNKPLIPVKLLPINSWSKLALDVENDHPLVPLIWYNFFVCFF